MKYCFVFLFKKTRRILHLSYLERLHKIACTVRLCECDVKWFVSVCERRWLQQRNCGLVFLFTSVYICCWFRLFSFLLIKNIQIHIFWCTLLLASSVALSVGLNPHPAKRTTWYKYWGETGDSSCVNVYSRTKISMCVCVCVFLFNVTFIYLSGFHRGIVQGSMDHLWVLHQFSDYKPLKKKKKIKNVFKTKIQQKKKKKVFHTDLWP